MTVTIRLRRRAGRPEQGQKSTRKTPLRQKSSVARSKKASSGERRVERLLFCLFLTLPAVTLIQTVLARASGYVSPREAGSEATVLAGPGWVFMVPFAVNNKGDIEKLIECESGGRNISQPDTDGITSDGILQFHRGPSDTLSRGTWEDFSRASGLGGSPRNPEDAIRMTDWAISHDLGPRWTCWNILGLTPGS